MTGRGTRAMWPFPICHHVLRLKRSNQYVQMFSSVWRRCRFSWKQELYRNLHLPERSFEAQQKKNERIMGPCNCTGALWDYIILSPVHAMDQVKKWFQAQIRRIVPYVFSYILFFKTQWKRNVGSNSFPGRVKWNPEKKRLGFSLV